VNQFIIKCNEFRKKKKKKNLNGIKN